MIIYNREAQNYQFSFGKTNKAVCERQTMTSLSSSEDSGEA